MAPFSVEFFHTFISSCGGSITDDECIEYLNSEPNVFPLANKNYVTRACVFTNQYFSIKPERSEVEKGFMIIGHRCMPFIDPEVLPNYISFFYKGEELEKEVIDIDSAFLLENFSLFGDEYSPQYIAQDSANIDLDLPSLDFNLPPTVKITAVSLERLFKDGFKYGDRLYCKVSDWDNCSVKIEFSPRTKDDSQIMNSDIQREKWYTTLENKLLESFLVIGPKSSIEEQLAYAFAENRKDLCGQDCGSISEFLKKTKKVGFELFGVETRLWFTGQDVPAVGLWNDSTEKVSASLKKSKSLSEKIELLPDYIEKAAIKNQLYNKIWDVELLAKQLYPNLYRLSSSEKRRLLLHLKNQHAILLAKYDRFFDSQVTKVRNDVLELFYEVNELVYAIDFACADLTEFPQQSLVVLSQIYAHIHHLFEVMETNPSTITRDKDEIKLSIEGMRLNFECAQEELQEVLSKVSKKGFTIVE